MFSLSAGLYGHSNDNDDTVAYDDSTGGRIRFSRAQIVGLRNVFSTNPYPSKGEYGMLAEMFDLPSKTLHSWFQNHRHRCEKIQARPLRPEDEDSAAAWGRKGGDDFDGDDDMDDDSRPPYNPGHKKTKFSDHQRYYLQSFFSEKEYVDEEDTNDLSAELMLSPKVIRIWFQHARERKKKNLPILPTISSSKTSLSSSWSGRGGRGGGPAAVRGKPTSTGRPRGRPPKVKPLELDDGYFGMDDDDSISNDAAARKPVFAAAGKTSSLGHQKTTTGEPPLVVATKLTEFQKLFLEDFYAETTQPDSDALDYLGDRINTSRANIIKWFANRNQRQKEVGARTVCAALVEDLIADLDLVDNNLVDSQPEESFNCPYCGRSFAEEKLLREHERIEAIEFEKEAQKFKEVAGGKSSFQDDAEYVTIDDILGGGDQSDVGPPDFADNDLQSEEESEEEEEEEEDGDEDEEAFYDSEYYLADRIRIHRDEENGQEGEEVVKRPLNPFMVWLQEERKKLDRNAVSRPAGQLIRELASVWRSLPDEDKMPYIEEARRLKEAHQRLHPNYRFQPMRKLYGMDDYQSPTTQFSKRSLLVKNYVCKRCNVGFTTKGNLFKHLRNFHPDNPYDSNYYELPQDNKKDQLRGMKRCARCGAEFLSNVGLARHMQQVHPVVDKKHLYPEEEPAVRHKARTEPPLRLVARRSAGFDYAEPVSSSSDRSFFHADEDSQEAPRVHVKTRFTAHQRVVLMDSFQRSLTMSKLDAKQMYFTLAERLNLPVKIVRIWFQNARSARKRGKPIFSR